MYFYYLYISSPITEIQMAMIVSVKKTHLQVKGKQTHNLKFPVNRLIQIPVYGFSCLSEASGPSNFSGLQISILFYS